MTTDHPSHLAVWQGRTDIGESGHTQRLFDIARPFPQHLLANAKASGNYSDHANSDTTASLSPGARVLLGFCCDTGVQRNQGRPGAVHGPQAIRSALANLPAHTIDVLYDAGNVYCLDNQLEQAQQTLAQTITTLLHQDTSPLILGGGHEMAWGTWQGLRTYLDEKNDYGRLLILNLDAHFDLRTSRPAHSGTPFDQIATACQHRGLKFDYHCWGVSKLSNTAGLFTHANELGVHYLEDSAMQERHIDQRLNELNALISNTSYIYLSVDLDVLSWAIMPAVSAPAAYGVPLPVIEAIIGLIKQSKKLRVADIAEFNPSFDSNHCAARVAARLAYHLLA